MIKAMLKPAVFVALLSVCAAPAALGQTQELQPFPPQPDARQEVRLHHVTLFAREPERIAEWYVRHLGFVIVDRVVLARGDGARLDSVRIGIRGLWINLSRLPNLAARDPALTYAGWRQISLAVRDLPAKLRLLRDDGVEVLGAGVVPFTVEGSRFGQHRFVAGFLRDPEGNVMELYEDL